MPFIIIDAKIYKIQYYYKSDNITNEKINYAQAKIKLRKSKIKKNKLISIKYIILFIMTDVKSY